MMEPDISGRPHPERLHTPTRVQRDNSFSVILLLLGVSYDRNEIPVRLALDWRNTKGVAVAWNDQGKGERRGDSDFTRGTSPTWHVDFQITRIVVLMES